MQLLSHGTQTVCGLTGHEVKPSHNKSSGMHTQPSRFPRKQTGPLWRVHLFFFKYNLDLENMEVLGFENRCLISTLLRRNDAVMQNNYIINLFRGI